MSGLGALRLAPHYAERVWGGQRLKPNPAPIGEAWIVWEDGQIAAGPWAGRTLGEVAAEQGQALLGRRAMERTGSRFPLLIKLLDTAEWLSLQVHPKDEQAARLEGPDQFGKTEAWHILQTDPDAQLICGLLPDTSPEEVAQAIKAGTILDHVQYLPARAGDTVFVAAGTIHALGPGLLLYEVQQTSDITYRVFDWNRPQTAGRVLHIEKSLAVTDAQATGHPIPMPVLADGMPARLVTCPYFSLELVAVQSQPATFNTENQTFHALTVIEGAARVEGAGWSETLEQWDSVVVPASTGGYQVRPGGSVRLLKASVE